MSTAKPNPKRKRDLAAEILHGIDTLKAEALGQIPPLKRIHVQVIDKDHESVRPGNSQK